MGSGSSKPAPDLEWKRGAVEAFGRDVADEQQTTWLKGQLIDTNKPASEQTGRLDDILAQAQIEVVEAMRSEEKRKELSADDRVFLKSKDINPEIPAADQEVRIEKLLDKLAAVC